MLAEHGTHVPPTSDCDLTMKLPLVGLKFPAAKPPERSFAVGVRIHFAAASFRRLFVMLGTWHDDGGGAGHGSPVMRSIWVATSMQLTPAMDSGVVV